MTQEIMPHGSENQPQPQHQSRGGLLAYFKDSWTELHKVVWPKRSDAVRMTFFVMVFVAVFALFIYGVDMLITWLFNMVLVKG